MDHERTEIVETAVAGGGLAGLLAAITAARTPGAGRVVLFDAHPLGGRARCDDRAGFTFNRGPRALYVGGLADRTLTGLGIDTCRGGPPNLAGAGAVDGDAVHLMPQGVGTALRTSLMAPGEKFAFAKAMARFPRTDPATLTGTTVATWLDQLGLQGAPRRMFEALIRVATYTNAPDQFDAGAAAANAQAAMAAGVRYLDGGWQVLVDALAQAATDAGVQRRDLAVETIATDPDDPARLHVTLRGGPVVRARSAIVAVGGPEAAAAVLGEAPDSWATLGPPVTVACLELGLRHPPPRRFILGIDEPTYLSTHAPPAQLAPDGAAVVHLLRYQLPGEDRSPDDDRAGLDRLAARAGITPADVVTQRFLARMVVTGGLPTAAGGGLAGRPPVEVPGRPGVFVAGDWVGPDGLLLDAVAASAVTAGRRAAAWSGTLAPA